MTKRAKDPLWDRASRTLRTIAKVRGDGWRVVNYGVIYCGTGKARGRKFMVLTPPPATRDRGQFGCTLGYRRGDGFMRRGPYYSLLVRYDQQEREPLP